MTKPITQLCVSALTQEYKAGNADFFEATIAPIYKQGNYIAHRIRLYYDYVHLWNPSHRRQFFGIHKCLILTMVRPEQCWHMLPIIRQNREIPPFGPVDWLGSYKARTRKMQADQDMFFQRTQLPLSSRMSGTLKVHGMIRRIPGRKQWVFVEFPTITSNLLVVPPRPGDFNL